MRLWTIHPMHLDTKGLLALWREGLLAQQVLRGATKGYRNHPQLLRFKAADDPVGCIKNYLYYIYVESIKRGFHFNHAKITGFQRCRQIKATRGQLRFEWSHFKKKVRQRNPGHFITIKGIKIPPAHPLFTIVDGPKEEWEKG
jgi:hypothetical protein